MGADAAWDDFADGTGLKYEIYISSTPFGRTKPGDLDRISYGASPEELARASVRAEH